MIRVSNLALRYGDRDLFEDISVSIPMGMRIGLIGRNGAGKSTFLKILSDKIKQDSGSIEISGDMSVGYLEQDILFVKDKNVLDETLVAFEEILKAEAEIEVLNNELMTRTDYEADSYMELIQQITDMTDLLSAQGSDKLKGDAQRILQGLGFTPQDMDRSILEFSGGWQMRIVLAKLLLQKPDFLLLDEPTNHLDIESIIWLEKFLLQYHGTVITISHDKMFLENLTQRVYEVELGTLYEYKAGYKDYHTLRAERKEKQLSAYRNQQKEIETKEKLIEKFRAKANKAKMAQSLIKQLNKLDKIELDSEDRSSMKVRFNNGGRSGLVVVDVKDVSHSFGEKNIFNNVSFQVERGEKVAFVGQNGQGKTTLAKIIVDLLKPSKGETVLGSNVKLGYYAQDQAANFDGNMTLLEVMESEATHENISKVRNILGSLLFSGEDVEKKIQVLSGGERARLALAVMLLKSYNLLILDEPTNHLDLLSKEILKAAVKSFEGTVIVVSHDRDFLDGLTDLTVEFMDGKVKKHIFNVATFLEKKNLENMREVEKTASNKIAATSSAPKKQNTQNNANDKELKSLEKNIDRLEKELVKMETKMGESDFYTSPESEAYIAKYEDKKSKLSSFYEKWENIL